MCLAERDYADTLRAAFDFKAWLAQCEMLPRWG